MGVVTFTIWTFGKIFCLGKRDQFFKFVKTFFTLISIEGHICCELLKWGMIYTIPEYSINQVQVKVLSDLLGSMTVCFGSSDIRIRMYVGRFCHYKLDWVMLSLLFVGNQVLNTILLIGDFNSRVD